MGKIENFDNIQWKPFKKRIGNIEISNFYINERQIPVPLQNHLYSNYSFFGVSKLEPNSLYGKENQYNWEGDYAKVSDFYSIHKDCFKNKENRYMIANWTNLNNDEYIPDLIFVGNRPFHLSNQEKENFWECVKTGQKYIEDTLMKMYD